VLLDYINIMDKLNKSFFEDTTHLPSSNNVNHHLEAPALIEQAANLDDFDFASSMAGPLHDGIVPPPTYLDPGGLMNTNFQPNIGYHDDNNVDLNRLYVHPANLISSSGFDQGLIDLQDDYTNGNMNLAVMDPTSGVSQHQGQRVITVTPVDPTLLTLEAAEERQYLNSILSHFSNPLIPLHVIDRVNFPFEQKLRLALEEKLKHEKQQELVATLQNGMAYPAPAQSPAPSRIARVNKAGNKRPENIKNFDPADFYEPLQNPPASWGSINPDTGDKLFQYSEHGELNPLHNFTVDQIVEYISKHPLHNHRGTKKSGLKLWVQTVPADSGRRYPDKLSDKCRFAACPDPFRTIRKGEFRVCFDEQSTKRKTDPFHNAGYVHLFCMEKFLDFPQVCKEFNVLPDTRVFREGKNRMAITRDHESMAGIVRDFIGYSKPWQQFTPVRPEEVYGQRPAEYYQYTLSSALTREHLEKQPKHLQKIREMREGNSIDIHKNNLDKRISHAKRLKENKRLGLVTPKPRAQKRKSEVDNGEENVLDKNVLGLSPRPNRQRKESASSTSSPKSQIKERAGSSRLTKRRRSRSTASANRSMRVGHKDADFVFPRPKKRKHSDSDLAPESETMGRKSSRSPKMHPNISWTDEFHVSGLRF
jgi:hypothetical protein